MQLQKKEQFQPEFLALNPNNKIPVIIDEQGPLGKPFCLFESAAILHYLAQKTGKFWPQQPEQQALALQWLFFESSNLAPMIGQLHHFLGAAPEPIPYAIERYHQEVKRLYRVLNQHLSHQDFFVDEYSIADMAVYPWVKAHERHLISLDDYPHVQHWFEALSSRPGIQQGMAIAS